MSTLIVAIIIITSLAAICLWLISINNKQKHKTMKELLHHFSESGTKNDLNFSSQELLLDGILGLDGIQRKLLMVKRTGDHEFAATLIRLDEVKSCSVKKHYTPILAGGLKHKKLEQHLEKIVLHFELSNKPAIEIAFYQHVEDHIYKLKELEQKAKHWEAALSKLLRAPLKIA